MRAYVNSLNSEPSTENHVHPQSRHWFVHVQIPDATYYVELGLYAGKEWHRVAVAGPITTPARRFAFDTSATWLTIRHDLPLAEQLEARRAASEFTAAKAPAAGAFASGEHTSDWSPEQQDAVLRALGVIRVADSLSSDSGKNECAEDESVSSAGGGFGEPNAVADLGGSGPASSDVPLFSLLESPISSS
jgi:hypothetical protein